MAGLPSLISERIVRETSRLRTKTPSESPLVDPGARFLLAREFARQRQQFQIVLRKVEGLASLPGLSRPGFRLAAELARETLSIARRTDFELARGADAFDAYFPQREYVEQLVERTSDLQDRLQRQLALVAQWQADAMELQAEFELLIGSRHASQSVPFDGLRAFTRKLISELLFDVSPPVLHAQLALDMLTERLGNVTQARVYAVALASAQVVARVARVTWLREDQVELVTAAALLQDCGKLVMPEPAAGELAISHPTIRRHTRVGAALVAGYRQVPAGLTDLIASHHRRRNDGSALPATSSGMPSFTWLLAAASRFERLRLLAADRSNLLTSPELVDRPAIVALWNETRAGSWDAHFVSKILAQRDGTQGCLVNDQPASVSQPHYLGKLPAAR